MEKVNHRKLVIAMDCDDLLVPNVYNVLDYYRKKYKTIVDPEHFYEGPLEHWGVADNLELQRRFEHYYRRRKTLRSLLTPFPGAVENTRKWAHVDGHELHLVTSRSLSSEHITRAMADLHFENCFQSITHLASFNQSHVRTKGDVCAEIGADLIADDHILHCEDALEKGTPNAIVFGNYEWNRRDKLRAGLVRCIDWDSTDLEVQRLASV